MGDRLSWLWSLFIVSTSLLLCPGRADLLWERQGQVHLKESHLSHFHPRALPDFTDSNIPRSRDVTRVGGFVALHFHEVIAGLGNSRPATRTLVSDNTAEPRP